MSAPVINGGKMGQTMSTAEPKRARAESRRPVRWLVLTMAMVMLVSMMQSAGERQAAADTAPRPGVPATVSSDPLPTAQMNGVAWSQIVVGNKVYVGGEFTRARPAGAALGSQEVNRSNLLAYNLTTGVLDSFAPTFNGPVRGFALSPDGTRLYVVGSFTSVNGQTRNRVAVFNTTTGALLTFAVSSNYLIYGVVASATTVYLAGPFSSINGTARAGVAAVDATTGTVRPFAATPAGGQARQVVLSPDQQTVIVGGSFTSMNGSSNPGYGLAALNATSGATKPLPVNGLIRNGNTNAAIINLVGDSTGFYGTGYSYSRAQGNFEGAFKADWNGNLVWLEDCHGDTYSVAPAAGAVYVAGHPHYCGNVGGFPQTDPWTFQRGMAFTNDVRGTVAPDIWGYANFDGRPRPQPLHFLPDINTGTYTGQTQGPWTVAGNADYVVYGGEFTRVNNKPQQGLVRFARVGLAPNDDGPRLANTTFPISAQSFGGAIRVNLQANHDRDNESLTYELLRNGIVVDTAQAASSWWQRPWIGLLDTGVTQGQTYSYRVRVLDPFGNQATSPTISATASGGRVLNSYDRVVLGDGPLAYWPMDEGSGTAVADLTGRLNATGTSSVTKGRPGISSGGTSFGFNGSNSVGTNASSLRQDVFSVEAWFKTTSTQGGKIIGFGSSASGSSASYDRNVYLTANGRLRFGVTQTTNKVAGSPGSYNNGQWHHVVGVLDPTGIKLFVDGALVSSRTDASRGGRYDGYWRIGGDRITGWPDAPSNGYLVGDIDQAAVYNRALLPTEIATHWSAGTGSAPANQAPTASFTTSTAQLGVSVNGSGSVDTDGTIVSYQWQFGDGSTASGVTASHTYQAAGTYTVQLTVVDDDGAPATTTRTVTVTGPGNPAVLAQDEFGRTLGSGWGNADVGGAWTLGSAASGFSVGGGSGRLLLQTAGARRTATLPSVSSTSTDLRTSMSVDKLASIYLSVYGRRVSSTSDYRVDVNMTAAGSVTWTLNSAQDGATVRLATPVTLPQSLSPGTVVQVRLQTTGTGTTTVRAKVWVGTAAQEPSAWGATSTNGYAALQSNGSVGMSAYVSGSAVNAPIVVSVPSFVVETVA